MADFLLAYSIHLNREVDIPILVFYHLNLPLRYLRSLSTASLTHQCDALMLVQQLKEFIMIVPHRQLLSLMEQIVVCLTVRRLVVGILLVLNRRHCISIVSRHILYLQPCSRRAFGEVKVGRESC